MNFSVLQVFYALFSGTIQGFAIANELIPFGSPFLALFCVAPLYISFYKSRSYGESFLLFFIQTLTVHLISSYWLANFHGFAAFTLGASALGTAFEGGALGLIAYVFPSNFTETRKLREKSGLDSLSIFKRMLWFTGVWVLYEYVKSTGAMGYPWGTVFMAAYKWKIFTQIADVTGVWGITFLFILFSCLFAEGLNFLSETKTNGNIAAEYRQAFLFTVALFALSGIYGIFQYSIPRNPEKYLNAVLVQQNVDPWETEDRESIRISKALTDKGMEDFAENGIMPDIVVWSEGVLSKNFPAARYYYARFPEDESLKEFIANKDTPFLIGGGTKVNQRKRQISNSAILFDSQGNYSGFYSKIQLVPFGEKIPYFHTPIMQAIMKNLVGMDFNLTSGFQYVLFQIPLKSNLAKVPPLDTDQKQFETIVLDSLGRYNEKETLKYIEGAGPNPDSYVRFTTPICFEDAFPYICRNLYKMGSEVFLNITNDSWSKTRSSEIQHFIIASFLSIEFRTTLVRCANSGYSVVVDPAGKVLYDMPLFKEDALACPIPVFSRNQTLYATYGDWLPCIIGILTVLYIAFVAFNIHFGSYFTNESDEGFPTLEIPAADVIPDAKEKTKANKRKTVSKEKTVQKKTSTARKTTKSADSTKVQAKKTKAKA